MKAVNATGFGEGNNVSENTGKGNPVFGIDLGTTNSAISVVRSGTAPEPIKLKGGRMTMPSCIEIDHGKIVVGRKAYADRATRPEAVVYSVKTLMQDPDAVVTIKDGNDTYTMTPAEVSAEILKGIVAETGGEYGEIKDVVVTVPAYFNQNGINATKKACELAGLNLVSIANEPTAASLCYKLDDKDSQDILVFDLGGGTFDTTLMRISQFDDDEDGDIYGFADGSHRSVVTLGIRGDMHLGGDNLDEELLKIILKKLKDYGVDVNDLTDSYLEGLKLRLETNKKAGVESDHIMPIETIGKSGREIKSEVRLTPDDFEAATRVIYNKAVALSQELLTEIDNNCSKIVLVGGSTKNVVLKRLLAEDFPGFEIDDAYSPDLSVAEGAAIQGKVYKYGDSDVQIFDIIPLSIGVALADGTISRIIEHDTPLPTSSTKPFATDQDDQTQMGVGLFQGNSKWVEECVPLGKLSLTDLPKKPAGRCIANVTLSVSADRILKCYAECEGQRKELELDLTGVIANAKGLTAVEKDIRRFKQALDYLSDEDAEKLNDMIAKYQTGDISKADIKEFIKRHKKHE